MFATCSADHVYLLPRCFCRRAALAQGCSSLLARPSLKHLFAPHVQRLHLSQQYKCRRTPPRAFGGISEWPTRLTPLETSQLLAAVRLAEASTEQPQFWDPLAAALLQDITYAPVPDAERESEGDTTKYLDEQLLQAVQIANMDLRQGYNQVVLLGCGFDTRPFRLPWPTGTVLYLLAPAEVHKVALAALQRVESGSPRVPRGCLLRRVAVDLEDCADFGVELEAAGYQGNKLSVWGLQGLSRLGLKDSQVATLLGHIANMAALQSFVIGELPPATAADASKWIAEAGWLGNLMTSPVSTALDGSNVTTVTESANSMQQDSGKCLRRLFFAQQQKLSLPQMRLYNEHLQAGKDDGEDFEGNFS